MNEFMILLLIATISGVLSEVFGSLILSAIKHVAKALFAKRSTKKRTRELRPKH